VLKAAKFLVGDDQEVPGSTGGVEHFDLTDALEECLQLPRRVVGGVELVLEPVEEEGLDRLEDVRDGRVVLP
jgi:hypothetical protein